jgi:hypothetical protein
MKDALIPALIVLAVAAAGCGGDGSADEPTTTPQAQAGPPLCPEIGSRVPEPDLLERAESLLGGEPLDVAEEIAEENGCHIAPTSIDGEPQPLTREYDPTRIQVEVRDDLIREVLGFG